MKGRRGAGALSLWAVLALAPAAAASSGVTVSPLQRITGATALPSSCSPPGTPFHDVEVEPSLAVDPRDGRRLVAAWIDGPSNVTASSRDAGRRWQTRLVPGISRCTGGVYQQASDPWLSIGPEGTTYLASVADSGRSATAILMSRSRAPGGSWSAPIYVDRRAVAFAYDDKEAVTADRYRPGAAYVVWAQNRDVSRFSERDLYFATTTDSGGSWSTPARIYQAAPGTRARVSEVIVTGRRRLVCVLSVDQATPEGLAAVGGQVTFLALRSGDGGRNWSAPSRIAATRNLALTDPERGTEIRASAPLFSADADPQGRVYVAWRDARSSSSSRIVRSTSRDGRRWSRSQAVSRNASRAFLPDLAVAGDGTVAVRFYDLRMDRPGDAALTTDSWLSYSKDGGNSWAETRLGGSFDLRTAPVVMGLPLASGLFIGDYEGLVAVPGGFATVFARSRPAARVGSTDLFLARIQIEPSRGR